MFTRARLCTLLGLILVAAPVMYAQTPYIWTGATTQILNDGTNTNWLGGVAPPNDGTAQLVFAVPANPTSSQAGYVQFSSLQNPFNVASITFSGSYPQYSFSAESVLLGIGTGGIAVSNTGAGNVIFSSGVSIQLNADQTWTTAGNLEVDGAIAGSFNLTKNGTGTLKLGSSSPAFTGNLTVAQGTLALYNSYSAGTGNVILQSGTTLVPGYNFVVIPNNVTVSDNVTFAPALYAFGLSPNTPDITIAGSLTAASNSVRLHLAQNLTLWLSGSLSGPSNTSLTVDSGGAAILTGPTSSTITSLTADGGGLIFAAPGALPAAGSSIRAIDQGYIGVGATSLTAANVPSPIAVLGLITNKAAFNGTFGFDTDPQLGSVYTYTDPLDFSAFSTTTFKIGSASAATLGSAAIITPPTGGPYRFGDGGGRLIVQSALTAPTDVIVNSTSPYPLTLVLQGTNTFTGNLWSTHSYVVLDSTGALPSGSMIHLGPSGYVSYTPNWGTAPTPADLIVRLSPAYGYLGILGFDSAQPATVPLTVAGNINLAGLPGPIYLGTTTHGLTLTGTITPPNGGMVELAGVNSGLLKVTSNLTAANGVTSVVIGHPDGTLYNGPETVELDGTNTYTGGTTLFNGSLFLGNGSALGTGALTIANSASIAVIVPTVALALNNSIVANNGLVKVDASSFPITFNGAISGSARLGLAGNVTLNTANSYSGGTSINTGASPATITVNNNTGLGSGDVNFSGMYATVNFTTLAPSIGSLSGYSMMGGIVLPVGATALTINQTSYGLYSGPITGPVNGVTNASLVKNGPAGLILSGTNKYSGGTQINGGQLIAASSAALGIGTVTINGGSLGIENSAVIPNTISFGASGGTLGGNGTIGSSISVGSNVALAPGDSPGTLTFTGNLTWAPSGSYNFEIVSAAGNVPGTSYDTIVVTSTGSFAITANSGGKFSLNLLSLSNTSTAGNIVDFNAGNNYSWQIASSTNAISGFSAGAFKIDTTGFTNPLNGGFFNVSLGGTGGNTALFLNFTPVPEPSTWALLLCGAGAVLFPALRRRRS